MAPIPDDVLHTMLHAAQAEAAHDGALLRIFPAELASLCAEVLAARAHRCPTEAVLCRNHRGELA